MYIPSILCKLTGNLTTWKMGRTFSSLSDPSVTLSSALVEDTLAVSRSVVKSQVVPEKKAMRLHHIGTS